ncbi:MAG: type IV pilus twitching motility protein PilT [Oligoflexus sp.]
MERFKKSLKIAITEKVEGIRLAAGQPPCLLSGSSEQAVEGLSAYTTQDLESLIQTLMPHIDSVERSEPVQGELSIVNFGELKLIGHLGTEPRLFVFIPPQGNQRFRQVWNQLTEARHQPPLPIEPSNFENAEEDEQDAMGAFSMADADESSPIHENAWTPDEESNANQTIPPMMPPPPPSVDSNFTEESSFDPVKANEALFQIGQDEDDEADHTLQDNDDEHEQAIDHQRTVYTTPDGKQYAAIRTPIESYDDDEADQMFQPESSYQQHQLNHNYKQQDDIDSDFSQQQEDEDESYTNWNHSAPPANFQQHVGGQAQHVEHIPQRANTESYEAPKQIFFGPHVPGDTLGNAGERPIDRFLRVMIDSGASDMHLTLGKPVCLRVDGDIQRLEGQNVDEEQMQSLLLPIMPAKNQQEFADHHDTDFGYEVHGLARFRVNIFRDINGVGAVLRQIPDRVPSADDLDLPPAIRKFCELSKGLILVTGPTGSGKSTTLAAMIDLINEQRPDHILTIEDPIEFVHEQKKCLINQREVHRHTKSFSKALRAALREDPDIILIGEMRDLETIAIAIETAETGHLVFGTLHTSTAISTIDRLIDQFPSDQQAQIRIMLAESLKGVVSQTLVKKKGGGRVAAHEILVVDRPVSSLIREANTHMIQNHMQTQKAKGNIQLNDNLLQLVGKGVISPQDAIHRAVDKDGLLKMLQQKGLSGDLSQVS